MNKPGTQPVGASGRHTRPPQNEVSVSKLSELKQAIGPLTSIRIEGADTTITNIFDATSTAKVHAQARKHLALGDVVVWEDGTREWWTCSPDLDTSKSGSAMFTWAADGNRCRHTLNKHQRSKDGTLTVKSSKVWRKMD